MAQEYALVTGCSAGGIGSALVVAFQKRGIPVFATGRELSKLSYLKDLSNVILLSLTPTSTTSVDAALAKVKTITGGKLDFLVNNAGQTVITPTLDFDIETAKNMYDINVWGAVRVIQVFQGLVIAAKGTIVNVCSISTSVNTPWMGVYAGSKAALTSISDALRLEMAPFGVKVVTVHTGAVGTNTLSEGKNLKLPDNSRYKSIEKEILARARGEDGTPRMEPSEYAERVLGDVLRGNTWQIWRGGFASIVRFTSYWFPASVSDSMSIRGTGLDVMKA